MFFSPTFKFIYVDDFYCRGKRVSRKSPTCRKYLTGLSYKLLSKFWIPLVDANIIYNDASFLYTEKEDFTDPFQRTISKERPAKIFADYITYWYPQHCSHVRNRCVLETHLMFMNYKPHP